MKNKIKLALLACSLIGSAFFASADPINTIRKSEIDVENPAPRIGRVENKDIKRKRNYPMQPPVIPHKTRDYQVNLKVNKCLSCHSRTRTEESQAPMVSVTHFMDREGNFLAEVSPRRYFCQQCHVTQTDVKPVVNSTFTDMHKLMTKSAKE